MIKLWQEFDCLVVARVGLLMDLWTRVVEKVVARPGP